MAEAVYFHDSYGQSQQIYRGNQEVALAQMAAMVGSGWSASLLDNSNGQVVVGFINPNGVHVGVGIRGTDQVVGDGIRNYPSIGLGDVSNNALAAAHAVAGLVR